MNTIYTNNSVILAFLNKAQQKIASLSTSIVDKGGDDYESMQLALELSDFIENLDSCYCDWKEEDIIRWIHEYNHRADLNSIPYVDITGYSTKIVINGGSFGLPITTNDVSDYITTTNTLIRNTPHNSLLSLQGGSLSERYHVTKQMYDYLDNLLNPKIGSTVSLQVNASGIVFPSGYYELGTSISLTTLSAYITYNTYKQASYFEYTKNGALIGVRNITPGKSEQPNSYTDYTTLTSDTTYRFNAQFPDGIKSDFKNVLFRQPMYYGLIENNASGSYIMDKAITGTKDVRDRGEMSLTYNIPAGNTSITDGSYLCPYLFVPYDWGKFSTAFNSIFDFASDWTAIQTSMRLADGSLANGLLITYHTQIEGVTTFKFNW